MSRDLKDLTPEMQLKVGVLMQLADEAGLDLLVTCTYRSPEEQAALYAIGRTVPGKIKTRAKPWQSAHQYRKAVDCVPIMNGKPVWDAKDPAWQKYGELAEKAGLEWAGHWPRFKEFPHAQMPGFDWRAEKVAA